MMDVEFESKTHLLAILDNMPFMAWYKDDKGKFIAVNLPFAEVCGRTKSEIIGKTDFDIWTYEIALNYTNEDLEVMRTKEKRSFEQQVDDYNGDATWLEIFKSPVFDDDGNIIGVMGMAKDISKSKQFQLELENQKIFIKSMIDAIPDLIFYKDINSTYLGCNHAFAHDFIGLTEQEIIGKTDLDFFKDADIAKFFRQKDIEMFDQGKTQINEETVQLVNGNFVHLETSKTPFYNEDGEIAGLIGIARDITSRKNSEKKLKTQSDYSKMLLQTVPSGVYSIDNNQLITSWNHMAEKITGYTADEVMGKCADLFNFHPCRENCKLYINILSAPESNLTVQIKNKNGDIRYLRKNIDLLKNDLGEIIGTIECFDDITENVFVEKQLKESEMRLNLATSSAMIGLWDWNLQTGNTIYNEQWANIIGYSLDELQPISIQTWTQNTHPDDLEKSNNSLLKHFNGETEYYENEIRLKHKNGQWVWVLDRGKVIEWDSEKNPMRMVGTHIDITERKLIEEELKQKEKILSAAAFSIKELIENRDYLNAISKCFELIGTAIQVNRIYLFVNTYDDQGIYTSQKLEWNSGAYKSKQDNSKLENIPFEDLDNFISILIHNKPFYGITRKLEKCNIRNILESTDTLSYIVFPIFVEKTFWGFIGFNECKYERYWTDSEFSTLSAFSTSIGKTIERDLIEKTLVTSRQNAETANMLKSQFLANMSHEIRTPMHAILGYASLMRDIVENDESINYLNSIQKAGNMMMNLINDILDLSKIEAGKLELQTSYVDIRRLFDDIKEIFSLKIEKKNINIQMHIDPKIPKTVLMDEVRIRQILFNLVGNAVKFTDEGSINVFVKVSSFNEKDNLLSLTFKVQDTGIGIPEDQQSSIFNPFKQKDGQNNKKYGGTGLGLSISKKLIDIMNGSLSLNSKVNEGSTFIIDIPNISIGQIDNKIDKSEILNFEEQLIINNINSSTNKEVEIKNIEVLNPEMLEKMVRLKDDLWLNCINKNRVSDIKKLAGLVLEIGFKYNHKDTIEYAKLLQSYINSFDLKNTEELLKQYPTILEVYKSNINKQ
jgi:PAS domain S-box-containing protein